MSLEEFNHFFQESYPADLKKAQIGKDAIKKSGDMTIIKKIVRACTDNNGHTHLPKISKDNFNRLGVPTHIKNMNPDEYQMAYDYIKPIFDELRDPQQIHPDNFRSLKKKLFDLTGIGRPESHVITIIDKPLPGSVSFNIIQKKQNSLYKRTNKTKLVHFSNANNLSTLYPTGSSKVFNGHRYLYPNFRCYFWAIEGDSIPEYMMDYARDVYGKHIYQYIPKESDKIVIDMSESKRFSYCTPVFIETDRPLSVKDITNDININNINNTNDVSHIVDNNAKVTSANGKQSIVQDENYKVLKEFKSTEYAIMHVLDNFIHMKERTKNADKYRKLYNKIEENIEFDSDLITSEKTKCAENYPNAKNISLFDDLLKRYTKKVNAVLVELKNLIKKSNVVKEAYVSDDTSGTSDFDINNDNDPDDCYCESFDLERLSPEIQLRPADKYYLYNIIEWKMQTILEGYPNEQFSPEEYNKISNYVKNETPKMLNDTRIIMYDNDQPIGMIIAYQKEQDWFIDDIFLIPEFRYKGIGRMILENEIASHDQLALLVYKSNIHAISLYESLGFKVEESIKERQMMRLRKTDVKLIKGWRVTYQGIGIYEALKNAMFAQTGSPNVWMSFINSNACNWLPKPPSYGNNNRSFFTEEGFNRFNKLVLPIIAQYIDQTEIYIEEIMVPSNQIIYSDEFQFVTSDTIQEAYDAISGEEIPIDHAYTMDDMKERTYTEEELMDTIQEAKLPSKKRNKLPDSDFALVYIDNRTGKKERKYPIYDEAHCKAAARMFPRGVSLKYQNEVARKILRRAHKFGIDTSGWKNLNKFKESD